MPEPRPIGDHFGSPPPPCPDRNLLAGYAEGSLFATESASVERHLRGCAACRSVADAVAASAGVEPEEAAPRRRILRFGSLPAAAVLLVAATIGTWFAWSGGRTSSPRDTDAALVAAAEDLARRRPAQFGEFRPLDAAERAIRPDPARGGAAGPESPRGLLIDVRPAFRWTAVAGVDRWTVRVVRQDEVQPLWEAATASPSLAYPADRPALEPGRAYLWEAVAAGPLGEVKAGSAFAVASPEERRAFVEALQAIHDLAPDEIAGLLKSHLALRRRFLAEAESLALRWLETHAGDAAGTETVERIRTDPGNGAGR